VSVAPTYQPRLHQLPFNGNLQCADTWWMKVLCISDMMYLRVAKWLPWAMSKHVLCADTWQNASPPEIHNQSQLTDLGGSKVVFAVLVETRSW